MPEPPDKSCPPEEGPADVVWLRWFLLVCWGATLWYTWAVWQVRGDEAAIPNLPLGDARWLDTLPFPAGWLMIASLVAIAVRPVQGLIAHSLLLVVSIVLDQARLQPEFVSLTILLWATLPSHPARLLGRAHLVALWFFAGFHKLLSPGYLNDTGPEQVLQALKALGGWGAAWSAEALYAASIAVAVYELALGLLILVPHARRAVPFLALALHASVLFSLVRAGWNEAVWPWNAALAVVGFGLVWGCDQPPWGWCRESGWTPACVAVALLVAPILFYACWLDAYMAHCLYSSNVPRAEFYWADWTPVGERDGRWAPHQHYNTATMLSYRELNVPLPPEHRLFEQFFRRRARPGDVMEIRDSRWWAKQYSRDFRRFECEEDGAIGEIIPHPPRERATR